MKKSFLLVLLAILSILLVSCSSSEQKMPSLNNNDIVSFNKNKYDIYMKNLAYKNDSIYRLKYTTEVEKYQIYVDETFQATLKRNGTYITTNKFDVYEINTSLSESFLDIDDAYTNNVKGKLYTYNERSYFDGKLASVYNGFNEEDMEYYEFESHNIPKGKYLFDEDISWLTHGYHTDSQYTLENILRLYEKESELLMNGLKSFTGFTMYENPKKDIFSFRFLFTDTNIYELSDELVKELFSLEKDDFEMLNYELIINFKNKELIDIHINYESRKYYWEFMSGDTEYKIKERISLEYGIKSPVLPDFKNYKRSSLHDYVS